MKGFLDVDKKDSASNSGPIHLGCNAQFPSALPVFIKGTEKSTACPLTEVIVRSANAISAL